jgi:hypothetical protein
VGHTAVHKTVVSGVGRFPGGHCSSVAADEMKRMWWRVDACMMLNNGNHRPDAVYALRETSFVSDAGGKGPSLVNHLRTLLICIDS